MNHRAICFKKIYQIQAYRQEILDRCIIEKGGIAELKIVGMQARLFFEYLRSINSTIPFILCVIELQTPFQNASEVIEKAFPPVEKFVFDADYLKDPITRGQILRACESLLGTSRLIEANEFKTRSACEEGLEFRH